MNTMMKTQVKEQSSASFTPVRTSRLQRKCMSDECEERRDIQSTLRRSQANHTESGAVPPIVHEVLNSQGQPLDTPTRAVMERRFGFDFSKVRVHADSKATESARAVNALAYTVGRNVVFGDGQYAPGTSAGQKLMAHELVHVVQQSNGNPIGGIVIGDIDSIYEREAESASANLGDTSMVAAGKTPRLTATRSDVVQRIGPAAAAAGGAVAGAAIAIVSFEAALDYARSLATRFPGWLGVLPNCPCRESDVIADTATWGRDRNPILSWFHPGAASSYRSNSAFSTVPGSSHGQQCTYDSGGNLITEGPGAGTPDSWSPNTNGAAHTWYDVASWQLLGWRIYNRYWQPNNGNSCTSNRGERTLGRRISEFLP
jgi:hypothetical protein